MKTNLAKPLPLLPLRNTVFFPGLTIPVLVGRSVSIAAVKDAREHHKNWLVLATQFDEATPSKDNLPKVGVLAEVKSFEGTDAQGYHAVIEAHGRVYINSIDTGDNFIKVMVEERPDVNDMTSETSGALLTSLKQMAEEVLTLLPGNFDQVRRAVRSVDDLVLLSHLCSANIDVSVAEKQMLLETTSVKSRVLKLLDMLSKRRDELQVQSDVRDRLVRKLGKGQREAILRQQMNAIREELGEGKEEGEQYQDFRKKIDDAQMPEEALKIANEELKRLESIGTMSPESQVIRNYLELLCAVPWAKSSEAKIESLNLEEARKTLDGEHYGLEKVKKRILQHLAVLKLKKSAKGSILLFIGPPGVGKTSLGQSIAKALGRKFVRGSLGGVRDDAEIRGHRRTYIGAMPGRIIQSIKRAGENDPVFMLDEIDKMGRGFTGDPAAALLEVLDPEQNATFLDHYLDVPFDLSKVFFIATANSYEGIPGPLLDRMEVIDLSGYTTDEKLHIARTHLVPKALKEFGIEPTQFSITEDALRKVSSSYTREAGVREMQRQISTLIRANAEKVLAAIGKDEKVEVGVEQIEELLGAERFFHEVAEHETMPGVVTGLAWTPQGGEILFVETSLMPGKGELILTGQLGEVMRESAHIALSLVRSRMGASIPGFDMSKTDVHVHVPSGAIPKDGPSAGVAMLTAIASAFMKHAVDPKLAMTGEITLRGAVTPVGGIKEKVIAAHRAGIERVILCKRNERDLKDIPEEVRKAMKFELVDRAEDVLRIALGFRPTDFFGYGHGHLSA